MNEFLRRVFMIYRNISEGFAYKSDNKEKNLKVYSDVIYEISYLLSVCLLDITGHNEFTYTIDSLIHDRICSNAPYLKIFYCAAFLLPDKRLHV
jgi:hypothetical protein